MTHSILRISPQFVKNVFVTNACQQNNKSVVFRRTEIIPYSLGVRRCPGETLAKSEIYLAITALLRNFSFSAPAAAAEPSLEYNFGFTLTPHKFAVELTPRAL